MRKQRVWAPIISICISSFHHRNIVDFQLICAISRKIVIKSSRQPFDIFTSNFMEKSASDSGKVSLIFHPSKEDQNMALLARIGVSRFPDSFSEADKLIAFVRMSQLD